MPYLNEIPDAIPPMLAKAGKLPQNPEEYAFEVKWDGIRAILYYTSSGLKILSRNMLNITGLFPELAELKPGLNASNMVIDGEIVATDDKGRPNFSRLHHRLGLSSDAAILKMSESIPITYIIFDILWLNNQPLLDLKEAKRREILENLNFNGPAWQTPKFQKGSGQALLEACRELGLEGIIAKHLDSKYAPGKRPGTWIKIKNLLRQELVIGGWVPGQGTRSDQIGALLVGYYNITSEQAKLSGRPQFLHYAGAVGTGFNRDTLQQLTKAMYPLTQAHNPFIEKPPKKDAVFVKPLLVAEIEFTQWTPNNTLRHPSFKGLRLDKNPYDVVKEPIVN